MLSIPVQDQLLSGAAAILPTSMNSELFASLQERYQQAWRAQDIAQERKIAQVCAERDALQAQLHELQNQKSPGAQTASLLRYRRENEVLRQKCRAAELEIQRLRAAGKQQVQDLRGQMRCSRLAFQAVEELERAAVRQKAGQELQIRRLRSALQLAASLQPGDKGGAETPGGAVFLGRQVAMLRELVAELASGNTKAINCASLQLQLVAQAAEADSLRQEVAELRFQRDVLAAEAFRAEPGGVERKGERIEESKAERAEVEESADNPAGK